MNKIPALALALFLAFSAAAAVHRMDVSIVNTTNTTLSNMTITQSRIDITNYPSDAAYVTEQDFWNNVHTDGGDIRVRDINGNPACFWIEHFNNTGGSLSTLARAVIWVRLPSPLVPLASTKVRIDYGDPTQTVSTANGNGVFDFFDDFSSSVVDPTKWTKSTGYTISPTITTGVSVHGSLIPILGFGNCYVCTTSEDCTKLKLKRISNSFAGTL